MKIISPRAASGALGVSMSATSWEEYWGKLDSTPMPTTPQRARARVPGTPELSSASARQPHGQSRSVDIASTRIPRLYKRQKARSHRAFWQHRHAKSATQTSGTIRDQLTQNSRPAPPVPPQL